MSKPILCLDFDGVCHSYTSGWKGAEVIPDPVVPGLFDFLETAKEHFEIIIFSSRSHQPDGIRAMRAWFAEQFTIWMFKKRPELKEKFEAFICSDYLLFPEHKPAAFITIDDRAFAFNGKWPDVKMLKSFQPWYKQTAPAGERAET